jgi:hypothetical protein
MENDPSSTTGFAGSAAATILLTTTRFWSPESGGLFAESTFCPLADDFGVNIW